MKTKSLLAAVALVCGGGAAMAAPVPAFNVTVDIYRSENNTGNPTSADATFSAATAGSYVGQALYTGDLYFDTNNGDDSTTIEQWLKSAGGSFSNVTGFDETLTISDPNIDDGTATTTWFIFSGAGAGFDFQVRHDDGLSIIDDFATTIYSSVDPQTAGSFSSSINWDGGFIQFVYAATNGDPSVFQVKGDGSFSAVPLPAAGWMLLAGLGGLFGIRRLRRTA